MKGVMLAALLSAVPAVTLAQGVGAEAVTGFIRDEQGGAIPGASVEIACGATVLQAVTDEHGEFRLGGLPAGRCSLTAEAQSFGREARSLTLPARQLPDIVLPVRGFVSDVVVTGTRGRGETQFDSPQAASVVVDDDLKSRPFTLMAQALREEPGILVQQTTTAQTSPVIRGFTGQQNVYLVDGVRLNTASWRGGPSQYLGWIDAAAANRLEIVRGPASVQYGSDALGGTVQVFSAAPHFGAAHVGGEIDLAGATADRSAGGAVHLDVQMPRAALRVGFSGQQVGDLRGGGGIDSRAAVTRFLGLESKDVFGSRMPSTGFDQGAVYLSGAARAGAKGTVTGLFLHNNLTGSSRYDRIDGGNGVYRSGFDPQQLDFAVLRYAYRPENANTDWSAAFSVNRQADGRFEQTRPTAVLDAQRSVTTALGYQLEAGRRVSVHQLRAGVETYRESIDARRQQTTIAGAVTVQRPDIPDGTTYNTLGLFVSDAVPVGRATLSGGLRYGHYEFATVADHQHPSFGIVDEQVVMNAVTFNAGVVYSVTPSLNATFNVSRGFRAANASDLGGIGLSGGGGFGISPSRAAALGGVVGSTGAVGAVSTGEAVPALRPEVVYAFEPGMRFRAGRYSASLTFFDMEYLDNPERRAIVFPAGIVGTVISGYEIVRQDENGLAYIAQDIRPIGTSYNVGHSRVVGFETEGGIDLARNWTARGYFSMSNGHVVDDGSYLSKMPPPMGGASLRWNPGRFWVEGVTMFARPQTRLSAGDLTDARIGATRTRTSIANYFNGSAVDLGYVSNGILTSTGETLAQVQERVLGSASSAPMFTEMAGFVTIGARGGVRLSPQMEVIVIGENLADRNYRFHGSGADAPGANLQVRLRYRF